MTIFPASVEHLDMEILSIGFVLDELISFQVDKCCS